MITKKITTISLFIFWAVVTSVLVAGLVFYQKNESEKKQAQLGNTPATILTIQEIANHSTIDNCWLLISGKVYDVTSYFSAHPGGTATILPVCGKDATAAYSTKDPGAFAVQGSSHSTSAKNLLDDYYIGDLNSTIVQNSSSPTGGAVQNSGTTTKSTTQVKPVVPPAQVALSMQEISKHNKTTDCWILISGKVYNITSYFGSHPGGNGNMSPLCGKDAAAAYATKDSGATSAQGSAHSANAQTLLAKYYIGDLNQTIGQQKIQQTNNVVPPTTKGDDDEYDD